MNREIYLDNNATTKIDEEVFNAMLPYLKENYGNPSSTYSFGRKIKDKVMIARKNVAAYLHANPEEIIFTSSASESNVTAIMSAIKSDPTKKHIITTKIEHASIMEALKYLSSIGYEVTYLSVDEFGRLDLEELRSAIREDTILITIMMANNEIGNIYPIKEIGTIAHEYNVLFHTDATQALGKCYLNVDDLMVDMLSFSGHKIHAPKGIGALYVKSGTPFTPLIFGHQENNRRGGTENVPYIVGLGKAFEIMAKEVNEEESKIKDVEIIGNLRDKLESKIKEQIADIYIYGDKSSRMSNTTSIAFKGVKADELLLVLESFNAYISTGSACNSELAEPSHVLMAMHANLEEYEPIRISLSKYTNEEEIDEFVKRLVNAVNMIRRR